MQLASWAIAYHGCDEAIGKAVLDGTAEVVPSTNDHDWLGGGAYFWENSYTRAFEWAAYLKRHPSHATRPVENPFVIGAIINPGNCLDLAEAACLAQVKEVFENLKDLMEQAVIALPVNGKGYPADTDLVERRLDCAVINNLHEMRLATGSPPFDTVRGLFTEGTELFPGAKLQSKTHVQWCVRHPRKSIVGYFRPRLPV